jgi:hypothetical protein
MSQTQITELTDEQKALLPKYRDDQIAESRRTDEADFKAAEPIIRRMLEVSNIELSPNFRFIHCRNPVLAAQAGDVLAKKIDGVGGKSLLQASAYGGLSARNCYLVEVGGVKLNEDLLERMYLLRDFTRLCGGVYLHSHFAIIYDRPSILKLVMQGDRGVLHCEDGPAIAWGRGPDGSYSPEDEFGYALYYWQGTRVPEHWILNKPNPDDREAMKVRAQEVLSQTNQETLRAGCEILGWTPILEALGMKVLDEDPNPSFGKLVSVDLPNAPDSRFIVAECGTGRTIAVPVSAEAKTAVEAGAMSYGVPVAMYRLLKVRT